MTPSEFKAWFDGFTEAFSGCPTKAQWARIKERVSEIDGKAITHTVYVDRYVRQYPYYPSWQQMLGTGVCTNHTLSAATGNLSNLQSAANQYASAQAVSNQVGFNSMTAMANLGRAEAANMNAA